LVECNNVAEQVFTVCIRITALNKANHTLTVVQVCFVVGVRLNANLVDNFFSYKVIAVVEERCGCASVYRRYKLFSTDTTCIVLHCSDVVTTSCSVACKQSTTCPSESLTSVCSWVACLVVGNGLPVERHKLVLPI